MQFSLSSHLYYLRIKLIMFLSKPFLFRCTLLLFKSILNFNLASLNTCESSSLTSNALLLMLSFPGTIPDILTFQVLVFIHFSTCTIDFKFILVVLQSQINWCLHELLCSIGVYMNYCVDQIISPDAGFNIIIYTFYISRRKASNINFCVFF